MLRGTTVEQHSPLAYRYLIGITAIDAFVAGLLVFRPLPEDRSSLLKYLLENAPRSVNLGCGPEFSPALFGLTTSTTTASATTGVTTTSASNSTTSGPTMYLLQQVCLDASLVVMRPRDGSAGSSGGYTPHPTLQSSSSSSSSSSTGPSNTSSTGRSGSGSGSASSNGGNNATLGRTDSSAQDLSERGQSQSQGLGQGLGLGGGGGGSAGVESERVRGGYGSIGRGSLGSRLFADDPTLLVRRQLTLHTPSVRTLNNHSSPSLILSSAPI